MRHVCVCVMTDDLVRERVRRVELEPQLGDALLGLRGGGVDATVNRSLATRCSVCVTTVTPSGLATRSLRATSSLTWAARSSASRARAPLSPPSPPSPPGVARPYDDASDGGGWLNERKRSGASVVGGWVTRVAAEGARARGTGATMSRRGARAAGTVHRHQRAIRLNAVCQQN